MIRNVLIATCFALTLTGCFSPLDFEAKVKVEESKDVSFTYRGKVIDHRLFSAFKQKQTSSIDVEEHERRILSMVNKKGEALKKYDHLGNGIVMVDYSNLDSIENYQKHQVTKINKNKDGSYTLTMKLQGDKALKIYDDARLKIDGNLEVELPKSAKVISHNADSEPSMFGSVYKWKYTLETKHAPTISFLLKD